MVKVLFDHNMPPSLARGLHEIIKTDGHAAFPLRDKFDIRIDDVEYFNILGKESDWIVISKDLRNSRKRAERAAILNNGLVAFYLSKSLQKKKTTFQGAAILWHWENILAQRRLIGSGLFLIPENKGKFRQL